MWEQPLFYEIWKDEIFHFDQIVTVKGEDRSSKALFLDAIVAQQQNVTLQALNNFCWKPKITSW